MKKNIIYYIALSICLLQSLVTRAQNVGINATGAAPDSSAMLDIVSTDKGLLIPRMDSISRMNILAPAKGLMVFDSTYNSFWYYNGTAWQSIAKGLDQQDISRSADSLYLTNNPTGIDLGALKQDFVFSNNSLSLSGSPSIADLSSFNNNNLGNHIASQNLQLKDRYLSHDGDDEGILIDPNGLVGINNFPFLPDAPLHVGIGLNPGTSSINNSSWNFTLGGSVWQSFSLPYAAYLNSFTCFNFQVPATQISYDFHLYEGEGTGGTLLYSGSSVLVGVRNNQCDFPDIPLLKDSTYTIEIIRDAMNTQTFFSQSNNLYARGRMSVNPVFDLSFVLLVKTPPPGYQFTGNAFIINEYQLPLTDGNANEVLMLDATGQANWTNLVASGFVDEMGNHQASQNLQLNNHWLSHNGQDNTGLYVDAAGQVGFKTIPASNFHVAMGGSSNPGFRVSDTGLTINEYSLPATDGMADQVWVSDGAGSLNWTTLTTVPNQQLSLSGDTLYLTSGGSPIPLTPYINADTLGDHTLSQDFSLGNHRIQNNSASNEGLQLNTQNALLVQTPAAKSGLFQYINVNYGAFIEVNNRAGTRALFGPEGNGYTGGATTDVAISNWGTYGDFTFFTNATERMRIDSVGKVGIGRTPVTHLLEVNGDASKATAGGWLANSDARLKKNIEALDAEEMLNQLLALQGIRYEWNDDQTGNDRPEGIQYGFTAQNIQEVFPSLVSEDNLGYLQTAYGTYDAMTVEALRALNEEIESLATENKRLETQLQEEWTGLKAMLEESVPEEAPAQLGEE